MNKGQHLKILFSPSEAKNDFCNTQKIDKESFFLPELFDLRLHVLEIFESFVQNADLTSLQKLFGLKDSAACEILSSASLLTSPTCKAILRYSGVAFGYLDYDSLQIDQKKWILNNLLLFSNLFGPIMARDKIPLYKFKQGATIDGFKPEAFYKKHFTNALDTFLQDEFIIDLRAGFYEKFYTIKQPHVCAKFLKNGKVVSHWSKAYRGMMVRKLAQVQPNNIKEFERISFDNLQISEVADSKFKREYLFTIV